MLAAEIYYAQAMKDFCYCPLLRVIASEFTSWLWFQVYEIGLADFSHPGFAPQTIIINETETQHHFRKYSMCSEARFLYALRLAGLNHLLVDRHLKIGQQRHVQCHWLLSTQEAFKQLRVGNLVMSGIRHEIVKF